MEKGRFFIYNTIRENKGGGKNEIYKDASSRK
jgi:hypothetical protein